MNDSKKYKGKYRIKSASCLIWNYDSTGAYFVTICVKNRVQIFGEVINRKIILNEVGIIVDRFWRDIVDHFPFIKLDEFVVMPDHVHGILWIKPKRDLKNDSRDDKGDIVETLQCNVSTTPNINSSTKNTVLKNEKMSSISPESRSLSSVIRSYKSICTREINKLPPVYQFSWQSRYYDHIIRNKKELGMIRKYIRKNPASWNPDKHDDLWKNLIPDYKYG